MNIRLWSLCEVPGVTCMSTFPTKPWRVPVQALLAPGSAGRCRACPWEGDLSVSITGDWCSSVHLSAHNPCASWQGLGSLEPCLAWGLLHGGLPTQLAAFLRLWLWSPTSSSHALCAMSWLLWAG